MSKTYIHTYVRAKYMHEDTDYIHTYITVRYNVLAAGSGLDEVTAPRLRCVARHGKKEGGGGFSSFRGWCVCVRVLS